MGNYNIKNISALELYDSRGNPTLEVTVTLEDGIKSSVMVPSGISTGTLEACELRDNNTSRLHGKGVIRATTHVNYDINKALHNFDVREQTAIDTTMVELDGTKNKSNLGSNAILGVSLAVAKTAALAVNIPLFQYLGGAIATTLPVPMMNIINGGAHADNSLDIQEFMIMPVSRETFAGNIAMAAEIFYTLKKILHERNLGTNCGDEGGYAPRVKSTEVTLDLIMLAIERAGYEPGIDILLALDVAASILYKNDTGTYHFKGEDLTLQDDSLVQYYKNLTRNYPIFSIEDPFAEDDEEGFSKITQTLGKSLQIVGDDFFVTNADLISDGIKGNIANAVIIKPNQVGTLSETLDAITVTKQAGYEAIVSHRSGETEDVTISHLAVGSNCNQIKIGGLNRTDRVAKYNELLRIENSLGRNARYAGEYIFEKFKNYRNV